MDLTVHIPDDVVPAFKAKASGLPLEVFAEQVLLERIHGDDVVSETTAPLEADSGMVVEKNGLRVYRTGKPMPLELVNDIIRRTRDERMMHIIGNLP
jgi:hypothetical protein